MISRNSFRNSPRSSPRNSRRTPLAALAAVLLCALLAGGCALGPDYTRPAQDMPAQWRPNLADRGDLRADWWTLYGDQTLNALVEEALSHNHDLAIAMARIDEARAYLGIARSAQLPSVSGEAGTGRGDPYGPAGVDNTHYLSGAAFFEIDLWGKYSRATEAARAELLATEAAYRTVRLAVIAGTARAYFALLSNDRQLKTARDTLKTRTRAEKLYHNRFVEGLSGEFEYRQSEVETTTAKAQVQNLEMAQAKAENALAVLTGRSPARIVEDSFSRPLPLEKLSVPDLVPSGLPSSLLERRPDIIEAEHLLHAATADIGVAKAAFFPGISLTGQFGWVSTEFNNIASSAARQWSVGSGLLQPIFQGGRLKAQLEAANARQKEAYALYAKTVGNAFREVLDALTANRITRERLVTIQTQVGKLRRTVTLANLRYESGQTNFLEVLDAQRALFNSEMELAKAYQAQLNAVTDLCQALGGGWERGL